MQWPVHMQKFHFFKGFPAGRIIHSELICPIHTKHVLVVHLSDDRTRNILDGSIFLFSLNIDSFRGVAVGGKIKKQPFCPSRLLHIVVSFALAKNQGFSTWSPSFFQAFLSYFLAPIYNNKLVIHTNHSKGLATRKSCPCKHDVLFL